MNRLYFLVEGQTEVDFVHQILQGPLAEKGVYASARALTTNRKLRRKGGVTTYPKFKNDLLTWMKEDGKACFTTMLDFYALPSDFPGRKDASNQTDPIAGVERVEQAIWTDFQSPKRLIPYIQIHEFEALLLADVSAFEYLFPNDQKGIRNLQKESALFETPEHVNDSIETAPAKRIQKHLPGYRKTANGPIIAAEIGLETMRRKCLHFNAWLEKLEALGESS